MHRTLRLCRWDGRATAPCRDDPFGGSAMTRSIEVPSRRGAYLRYAFGRGSAAAVQLRAGSATCRQAERAAEADPVGILGRQVGANKEVAAGGDVSGGVGNRGNKDACRGHEMSP
jgi:hypothetical protein